MKAESNIVGPIQLAAQARSEDASCAVTPSRYRLLGTILIELGRLSFEDVERILQVQKKKGLKFGEMAIKLGIIRREDVQQALSIQYDYPYLLPGQRGLSKELVAAYSPFSSQVEALRLLRSQILLQWFKEDKKGLAIVSPGSGDGRSYLVANLGIVFSQLGKQTLVLDADLRAPRQHAIFNISNHIGLSTILAGYEGIDFATNIPSFSKLKVLPAGPVPPNPVELLGRSRFQEIMASLTKKFDVVLIDTPPGEKYPDGGSIALCASGALMLVRRNHTRLRVSKEHAARLKDAGVNVLGAVFNKYG